MPSRMNGRQISSSAKSTIIQTLQSGVLQASRSETTGEASKTRSDTGTPAQKNTANIVPPKTIALPRSGCFSTSKAGITAIRIGGMRLRNVVGTARREENHSASIRMVAIFASSTG